MGENVVADPVNSSKAPANWFQVTRHWAKGNPLAAAFLLTIVATLVYFFGFVKLFANGSLSTCLWAWQGWNPETNYEHAKIIPLITIFLVWHARNKLKLAPVSSSRWGWLFIGTVRRGRPHLASASSTALAALSSFRDPMRVGRNVARILLFPNRWRT